jgi:hypothetical protein
MERKKKNQALKTKAKPFGKLRKAKIYICVYIYIYIYINFFFVVVVVIFPAQIQALRVEEEKRR